MVYFQTKKKFTAISYVLWPFGTVCGHLWYIFPALVRLDQDKSGNPEPQWP
jgi:hypothetical protein